MAAVYGYEDSSLVSIINATGSALQDMHRVNGQVLGLAGQLPSVNNSESGMRLSSAFSNWNSDFARVVNELSNLNDKANGLLQANRTANTDAAGTAAGG